MKEEQIKKAYELAKARYAEFGIDTDKAIETLERTPISLHCWQADDVVGFSATKQLRAVFRPQVIIPAKHATSTSCVRTLTRLRVFSQDTCV